MTTPKPNADQSQNTGGGKTVEELAMDPHLDCLSRKALYIAGYAARDAEIHDCKLLMALGQAVSDSLRSQLLAAEDRERALLSAVKSAVGYEPFNGSLEPHKCSEALARYREMKGKE